MFNQKLILIGLILLSSCIPPSNESIQKLVAPDLNILQRIHIKVKGETLFQLYHEYGFTDHIAQMILVLKPEDVDFLDLDLPVKNIPKNGFANISIEKFQTDTIIGFWADIHAQADIRKVAKVYDSGLEKDVFCQEGKYHLDLSDDKSVIYLWDAKTGLMYVEAVWANETLN